MLYVLWSFTSSTVCLDKTLTLWIMIVLYVCPYTGKKYNTITNVRHHTTEESINVKKKLNVMCFWVHFPLLLYGYNSTRTVTKSTVYLQEITRTREGRERNITILAKTWCIQKIYFCSNLALNFHLIFACFYCYYFYMYATTTTYTDTRTCPWRESETMPK